MDHHLGELLEAEARDDAFDSEAPDQVVRFLQYEVREGREAGEVVVLPKAFIANCNQTCILRLEGFSDGH